MHSSNIMPSEDIAKYLRRAINSKLKVASLVKIYDLKSP